MASRRMFSLDVIDTDRFLDMPLSAQCLYFHLGMRADDDGFVSSPRRLMKYIGSNDDDLKLLITKGYLIPFDSGVVVISDWRKNNYIQNDRYTPTIYKGELEKLSLLDKEYSLDTECIQDVSMMDTQDRLGKDRLGKDNITISKDIVSETQGVHFVEKPCREKKRYNVTDMKQGVTDCNQEREKENREDIEKEERTEVPYQEIADMYNTICISFPRLTKLSEARKKAIRARFKQYSLEDFKRLFEMAEGSSFLKGSNERNWSATFDWLIKDANMAKVLDGNYGDKPKQENRGQQPKKPFQQFTQRQYTKEQMGDMERMLLNRQPGREE